MNKGPYERRHIFGEKNLGKVYAQILEAHCTPSGKDPLVTVSKGHISISAPLLEVGWKPSRARQDENCWLVYLDPEITHHIFASFDFDLRLDWDETLHCLFIGEEALESRSSKCCGLVLQRKSGASVGMFEMVGTFTVELKVAVDFIKGLKESIIVMV